MASDSSAFSSSVAKNGHAFAIARNRPRPPRRAVTAARPVPSPYQPVRFTRLWLHANTHGIARRSSSSVAASIPRATGRDAIGSVPIWAIGVTSRKNATNPSVPTRRS